MVANENNLSDKDQLYKILLQTFFKEFVELFLPVLVHRIDFVSFFVIYVPSVAISS